MSLITGRRFGILGRAVIGVTSARIIATLYAYFNPERPGYDHPIYSWTEQALLWVFTGVLLGLLPGIMAREKSTRSSLE